ncbi:AMP-binding protein [Saccharopolyspora spinosporotrichia]
MTHSSGTTGVPKLVVHSAEALWHRLLPQKLWSWPMRGRKAAFCVSFVHSRFYHALGVFLHYGSPMVIAVDPAPDKIGPLFARTRPQVVETHPNTYVEWEQLADAQDRPLGAVRFYTGTFDAMHPRTIQRLLSASRQRNPLFLAFYGQSETGPVAGRWYTRRSAGSADGRCVGRSLPGFTRVRITSPAGGRAATGATGHIEVRSRSRAVTYLGEDARWQSQLSGGWWRMGDMGYKDRLGFLHLLDREADRIATVDSNLEAEDVLMGRLPELREVVIVEGPGGEAVPVVCTRDERPLDMDRWRARSRTWLRCAIRSHSGSRNCRGPGPGKSAGTSSRKCFAW